MNQTEHAATGAGQQFQVLFRAEWTRGRWVPWNGTFPTLRGALRAILEREGELRDRADVRRVAVPSWRLGNFIQNP